MNTFVNLFSNPMATFGTIAVIVVLGFWIYTENKKRLESGLSTGDYINMVLLEGHAMWVIYLILFVCVAEAALAASIHPECQGVDQHPINVPARFVAHFAINIAGTLMNIMLAQLVTQFISSMSFLTSAKKSMDFRYWMLAVMRLVQIVWVAFAAYYIPYFNYITIAQGLCELQNARWAFTELTSFITRKDLSLVYEYYRLGRDYEPLSHLSYVMFASFGAVLAHYILAIFDGISATIMQIERDINGLGSKGVNSFQDDHRRFASNPSEGIRFLIDRAGGRSDKQDVNNIVQSIVAAFTPLDPRKRSQIGVTMSRLVQKWRSLEAGERGGRLNQNARKALIDETRDFFRRSHRAGGLDRALSSQR